MSSVKKLADKIYSGLYQIQPKLRKVLKDNLPLAVAAMIEARTANTAILACYLPLKQEREELREQWLRRLLSNWFLNTTSIMAPLAKHVLQQAAQFNRVIELSMDQIDIGNHFAILVMSQSLGSCFAFTGKSSWAQQTLAMTGSWNCLLGFLAMPK